MSSQFNLDFLTLGVPERTLVVEKILTVYYHEFTKSYVFDGEYHDFWEFVYVDKGEVSVSADGTYYTLSKGEIIFHQPNEFHTISGNGKIPSNVLVTSFISNSSNMSFFQDKIMTLKNKEIDFLRNYIFEARSVFKSNMGSLYLQSNRQGTPYIGSEQMMYLLLEQFLISLIRTEAKEIRQNNCYDLLNKEYDDEVIRHVLSYLEENLHQTIYLDDICQKFFLSKTFLKKHFKEVTDFTVMEYLRILRINRAKELIREGKKSFTEIADETGYSTVHHFSSSFKQLTGMNPSDYVTSVK